MDEQKSVEMLAIAGKAAVIVAAFLFVFYYGNMVIEAVPAQPLGEGSLQAIIPSLLNIAELIIATQIFLMITRFAIGKYLENRGKKKEIKAILSMYTYLVWAFMGILLLTTVFKDLGALLTSLGLIGFGITFALQKPILNFVGWLSIVMTKPFNIGDRIEMAGITGDVISIHTMFTRVQGTRVNSQTKSDQVISIPNEQILTNPVANFSRTGDWFTDDVTFSITFASNWRKAIEILENTTESAIKKYIKNNRPVSYSEKQSWNEAADLLQEAAKKLRRGFVRRAVQEKAEMLKTAESVSQIEVPKPKIRMTPGQSSIDLNVLYKTDLYSVRETKHEVVRAFMEAIEKRDDIELAIPHIQLVYEEGRRRRWPRQEKLFRLQGPQQSQNIQK